MNAQQLRQSLKHRWLTYYRDNRDWLIHLAVWVNDEGQRRPSSSFILATLSVLEPRLTQLLPMIVGLNNSPDRIVTVLGLNFSPDDALENLDATQEQPDAQPKMLPAQSSAPAVVSEEIASSTGPAELDARFVERSPKAAAAQKDEACGGRHGDNPRDR